MSMETLQGFRLSPSQTHCWKLLQSHSSIPLLSECVFLIEGELNDWALKKAFERLVNRHDILRTSFQCWAGMTIPVQVINREGFNYQTYNLSELDSDEQGARLRHLYQPVLAYRSDLENNSPLNITLCQLAPQKHILIISLTSMCSDLVSMGNILREISGFYCDIRQIEDEAESIIQYPDYSQWHNELLESGEAETFDEWWREQDIASRHLIRFPFEGDGREQVTFKPAVIFGEIGTNQGEALKSLHRDYGLPVSTTLLACWLVLLRQVSGRNELTLGIGCDGRRYPELGASIGLFERNIPFHCVLTDSLPWTDLARNIDSRIRDTWRMQEYFSWERISTQGDSNPQYFGTTYRYHENNRLRFSGDLNLSLVREYSCSERCKVGLGIRHCGDIFYVALYYDSDILTEDYVRRLESQFYALISNVARRPYAVTGDLEVVGEVERNLLLHEFNPSISAEISGDFVSSRFELQADRFPDRLAALQEGKGLTYKELNERANQLAHLLISRGVKPESCVGICAEPSFEMLIGLFGVFKAGAAYVPIDPLYPSERLNYILMDSQVSVLLAQDRLLNGLSKYEAQTITLDRGSGSWEEKNRDNLGRDAENARLAYVIYTSGSTGKPKGVAVSHDNLALSTAARDYYYRDSRARFLLLSSFAFDSSVAGIFWTLSNGECLYLSEEPLRRDPAGLAQVIAESQITHMLCLPTLYSHMLEQNQSLLSSLEVVIVAGESCPKKLIERHNNILPNTSLYNEYGPTEATVWASVFDCRSFTGVDSTPIGRPIATAQICILDSRLKLLPQGVPGELCIAGAGLARGYLNAPDLTAERFIPQQFAPYPGGRLYRTGDLARHLSDGNLEYLGRIDNQVKIRGYRIELEEIEAILTQHPAVRQAVVMAQDLGAGDARLVGYIVPESSGFMERSKFPLYQFSDGLEIAHFNREETESIYKEIFQEQIYLRHGVTIADGDCVFDVGANIGLFTLFAHQMCAGLRIFAFEPIPQIFERLKNNVTYYGLDVELFNCGLSNKEGESKYSFYPNWTGMSGAYADARLDAEVSRAYLRNQSELMREYGEAVLNKRFNAETCWCATTTLSSVIRKMNVPRIDLLKVDVERSEWDVLLGIEEQDWGNIRQVVLEVHQLDGRLDRVTELLEKKGFQVVVDQEPEFADTGLYHVYALRSARNVSSRRTTGLCSNKSSMVDSLSELQQYLVDRLPGFMIPSRLTWVDGIPLTPNGKIDRQALLALPLEDPQRGGHFEEPRTLVEEMLAGTWGRAMGRSRVGRRDNFFELGGHSILATQIVAKIREIFRIEMSIRSLFQFPVLAQLSTQVETLVHESRKNGHIPPIQKSPLEKSLPLSYGQQRLWFLHRFEPESVAYNLPLAVSLRGPLNLQALREALTEILRRHEVLRTRFPEIDGHPIQVIDSAPDFNIQVIDLRNLPKMHSDREVRRLAVEEARLPFDLSKDLMLRVKLIHLGLYEFIALMTMHHISSDGWSLAIFIREMADRYRSFLEGRSAQYPELPIQYADYAYWQRQWMEGEVLERGLSFWKHQLSDLPIRTLPSDFPYSLDRSTHCGKLMFTIPKARQSELGQLALQTDATLFMVLLASYQTLLHYMTGENDVSVGTPFANRDRPEFEHSIGYFANTLVLRTKVVESSSFSDLLRHVRETVLEAYAHQDIPFDRIVKAIQPERDLARRPLFQTTFTYQNITVPELELAGVTAEPLDLSQDIAMYDLMLDLWETPDGLTGMFRYNADLFLPSTLELWSKMYQTIMENIVIDPKIGISRLKAVLSNLEQRHKEEKKHLLDVIRDEKLVKTLQKKARERVAVSDEQLAGVRPIYPGSHFPLLVQSALEGVCLKTWLNDHRDLVDELLSQSGALLFRGFSLNTEEDFEGVVSCISPKVLEYRERSSPRSRVRGNIYTSTNYPASQSIFFHNENSYQLNWPMKIAFFCARPASEGGYTPISDCRKVYERIGPAIRKRFRDKRILYVRNYSEEIGLSWRTAFQTHDKSAVERYCRQSGIQVEWKECERLRTRQIRPAIIRHPRTREFIWFNHAAFFHISTLDPETRAALLRSYTEDELPSNSYYGDGSPIEAEVLEEIREAYRQESITFPWERKDLLLLDNIKIAHGRTSYRGERMILVAMLDPHSQAPSGD